MTRAVPKVRIISDGKMGHENPMIGIAEAMGVNFEVRQIASRRLFTLVAPFGPIDPQDAGPSGPLGAPLPDICLASGRRTVPYLRTLKRRAPDTFCVYLNDPRTRRSGADMIVAMAHDRLAASNAFQITTTPHRFSPTVLQRARAAPLPDLLGLPEPRVAVLIGGNSRHHRFHAEHIEALLGDLSRLRDAGASLMISASRRTPLGLQNALAQMAGENAGVALWDGHDPNPMAWYLALADALVVTSDSINMVGEAAATGKPIHLFRPSGYHVKFDRFLGELSQIATIRSLDGTLQGEAYPPVNSTQRVAEEILQRYQAFHQ